MRALDLFCGGGGAGMGLYKAGFEVVGVDIEPQPKYPFEFVQADALTYPFAGFDFIWASPVCKKFSSATRTSGTTAKWSDQITPIRRRLKRSKKPWVIENVEGAPLVDPVILCGTMFGLKLYRHRLFEANFKIRVPKHPTHRAKVTKMGRPKKAGEFINPVGHFSGVRDAQRAMDIDWLGQKELAQAIPPAYSEYIARQWVTDDKSGGQC